MTRLRVQSRFILRGVWVRPEALGTSYRWALDGHTVTLRLPAHPGDLLMDDEPEVAKVPASVVPGMISNTPQAVSIQIIAVDVALEGAVSAGSKSEAQAAQQAGDLTPLNRLDREIERLWAPAHRLAERAAHAWLSHVRLQSQQAWLGLGAEAPFQYGRSRIYDEDTGVGLMAFGPTQEAVFRSGDLAMTLDGLERVRLALDAGEEPAVPEALLADARFLAAESGIIDGQRAVLIAAMAAEIKAKQALRTKTDSARQTLLGLVLRRVSNLLDLLDESTQAALGRTLRLDDPALWVKVKRLNELRAHVVHRGARVDADEAGQLVVAAGQVFGWLDGL